MSYAFLKGVGEETLAAVLEDDRFELLIDSGAFSAKNAGIEIDLDEYMAWLHKWEKHLHGYIALDVVQDPEATDANLRIMVKDGLKPVAVHVFGDTEERMDELFTLTDWVAIAGLRRPKRGQAPKSYVKMKHQWAKGRQVHWLGYTSQVMLEGLRPYSCDCASWLAADIWGKVPVYLGRGLWIPQFTYPQLYEKGYHLDPRIRRAVESYGVEWTDFLSAEMWRYSGDKEKWPGAEETASKQVCVRSWARYVMDFKRRFGVRIFLAGQPSDLTTLQEALPYV